jgi:hypothetical protein
LVSQFIRKSLFGEFLHTYEDTFGHRNRSNEPIDVNMGLGHAFYNHEPDKTYNDTVYISVFPQAIGNWSVRENRTLEAASHVFKKIQDRFGSEAKDTSGNKITFDLIKSIVQRYNAIPEDEENVNDIMRGSRKVALLNLELKNLGFDSVPIYDPKQACENRKKNTQSMLQENYPGTILKNPETCKAER